MTTLPARTLCGALSCILVNYSSTIHHPLCATFFPARRASLPSAAKRGAFQRAGAHRHVQKYRQLTFIVIPAKAGIHLAASRCSVPLSKSPEMDPGFRRDDGWGLRPYADEIPRYLSRSLDVARDSLP